MSARLWFGVLGGLTLAGLPARAGAQAVGSEFRVNTTVRSQGSPSVAGNASGEFVVVWHGGNTEGYRYFYTIFGQRYDGQGQALGANFRVRFDRRKSDQHADVAVHPTGHFVVVWDTSSLVGPDAIYGRRYDSSGAPLGGVFQVNSYTTSGRDFPSVATDAAGNFVVVWRGPQDGSGWGVFGQRFNSAGEAVGGEFQVNSFTTGNQERPSVTFAGANQFVVVWESTGQDGDGEGVFGQRFDGAGNALGAEFLVNSYTTSGQLRASIAGDASGNFVVVWDSRGQEGSSTGIFGQRFDATGQALGSEFQANSYTTSTQTTPSVASDAAGNFVVTWESTSNQDGDSWGVFGQRYDSAGVAQGDEFQINTYTTGPQDSSSVAATGTNEFVVVWEGTLDDIFGQRYDFEGPTITVVSPNTNVQWRIGSRQRIKWTHDLGLNATFRIELDRNDDGTYEELIADDVPVENASQGQFAWMVTGPQTTKARVRVSWTDDLAVADASDVTFQIRPAP
jgi:hypothetical protein